MIPNRFGNQLQMARTADPVEDDTTNPDPLLKGFKSFNNRRHTLGRRADVHHQENRHAKKRGQMCRRAMTAVKQPHHPFDHGNTRCRGMGCKGPADKIGAAHAHVQIPGNASGYLPVQGGINKVGSAFERLHLNTPPPQCRHDPKGKRCLAAAGMRSGHYDSGRITGHQPLPGLPVDREE